MKLELVLENCEVISFKGDDIMVFLGDIQRRFIREDVAIMAKDIEIRIPETAEVDISEYWGEQNATNKHYFRELIKRQDITQLYFNGHHIWVDWSDENEYYNAYQVGKIEKLETSNYPEEGSSYTEVLDIKIGEKYLT